MGRYHLLYLTPCSCLKKHLDQFLAPYRVYRGCFFAGSQKAEKQKGFMTILLVVKLTSATSIFSLFPFSHRSIPPSPSFPPPRHQTPTNNPLSPLLLIVLLFDFPTFLYSLTKSSFWSGSFVLAPIAWRNCSNLTARKEKGFTSVNFRPS